LPKFFWKSLLKCAEWGCSPGSVASLSTFRPLVPNRSVKSVARFLTGDARRNGCCAYAPVDVASRQITTATDRFIFTSRPPCARACARPGVAGSTADGADHPTTGGPHDGQRLLRIGGLLAARGLDGITPPEQHRGLLALRRWLD